MDWVLVPAGCMSAYDAVDGAKTLLTKPLDLGTLRNEIDTRVERRSCPIFLHREMTLMAHFDQSQRS